MEADDEVAVDDGECSTQDEVFDNNTETGIVAGAPSIGTSPELEEISSHYNTASLSAQISNL